MKKFIAFLLCAVMLCACVPFSVSAGSLQVVYLNDDGTGDGSAPDKAVASLTDAFSALDLSKDCTIVINGPYTQAETFTWLEEYTGTVTITSVYGGVDYRQTANANWGVMGVRYVMWGKTIFKDVTFDLIQNFYLVIAQCHELIVDHGTEMISMNEDIGWTGLKFANAFSVLGGFQNAQDDPPLECDKPVNLTFRSGKKILVGAYNRQVEGGNHSGKATIVIEGDAQVSKLYTVSVNKSNLMCGDVEITVKDQATMDILYGCVASNDGVVANSLTVNWLGGNMRLSTPIDGSAEGTEDPAVRTTYTNGTKLVYSDAVANHEHFATVSASFDKSEKTGSAAPTPADTTAAPTVDTTAAPTVDTTAAPTVDTTVAPTVDTTVAPTQPEPTPSTGDSTVFVVFAAAAVATLAAVVVLKKREER